MKSDGILDIHDVNCKRFFYGLKLPMNVSVCRKTNHSTESYVHPTELIVEFKWSSATLFYLSMTTTRSETPPIMNFSDQPGTL